MTTLKSLSLLSPQEREQLLITFNNTSKTYPQDLTVADLFEDQVQKTPDFSALAVAGTTYTYQQLSSRANQIAHYIESKEIPPTAIVGLLFPASLDLVAAILGVLKVGRTYMPLDMSDPPSRIESLSTTCSLILSYSHSSSFDSFPDYNPSRNSASRDLAYIIHTSGSTGTPKGVMVSHQSLVNLYSHWSVKYNLSAKPIRLLQLSSLVHDVFAGNLIKTLLSGGLLVLSTAQDKNSFTTLYALFERYLITHLDSTPSLIIPFLRYIVLEKLPHSTLSMIIVGSDTCPLESFRWLVKTFSACRVINSYGVTEASIYSSDYESVLEKIPEAGTTPIGIPYQNTQFYILDQALIPLPIGIAGELYIGGAGLAKGYLNDSKLTQERFMASPFKKGELLYKTGDQAKWLPDGKVELLGRLDFQIKIHGNRIQPSEVENWILKFSGISDCAVVPKTTAQNTFLICFYCSKKVVDSTELRQFLGKYLPENLIPKQFNLLPHMPLSPNGKLNRDHLANLAFRVENKAPSKTSNDPIINSIATAWKEVFNIITLGFQDSFFDLGGDSLLAIQIATQLQKKGIQASSIDLHLFPIFEDFCKKVKSDQVSTTTDSSDLSTAQTEPVISLEEATPIAQRLIADLRTQELRYFQELQANDIESVVTIERFSFSSPTYFHRDYFACPISFSGPKRKETIQKSFELLFKAQAILQSYFQTTSTTIVWHQLKCKRIPSIPSLSLIGQTAAFQNHFTQEVLPRYFDYPHQLQSLPLRVVRLDISEQESQIILLMDSLIHDQYGEMLLHSYFEENTPPIHLAAKNSYWHFVQTLKKGPVEILPQTIEETFQLDTFKKASKSIISHLQRQSHSKKLKSFEKTISIQTDNPLLFSISMMQTFFKTILGISTIPAIFVNQCRSFDNYAFRNTLGDFTDFVPWLIQTSDTEPIKTLEKLLLSCRQHHLHFLSLYHAQVIPQELKPLQAFLRETLGDLTESTGVVIVDINTNYKPSLVYELRHRTKEPIAKSAEVPRWLSGYLFRVRFENKRCWIQTRFPASVEEKTLSDFFSSFENS